MKTALLLLTFLTTAFTTLAQTGTLAGKVKDKTTGDPIIGATVAVINTSKGTTTDFNGDFAIPLDAGTYQISVTYVSYQNQNFGNIKIAAGQKTDLHVGLEVSATELAAVSVVGARQTNTDISLITEIKKSNIVVSGMSAEQIMKSQDRDAAEVVKRIPGITIMDNRFINVRGLAERYNTVLLNDALTPSSEVDVRAFSFDVLPTSVIDRVLIFKSPAPELPGDFAGGAVKVYTKNVVNENTSTFGISTAYRSGTTLDNFYTYQGSKTDLFGFDNGTRKLPATFPASLSEVNNVQKADAAKLLPNIWELKSTNAAPDLRLNMGLNRKFNLGSKQVSSISAVSYSNTRVNSFIERANFLDYDRTTHDKILNWKYQDEVAQQTVRLGVLQNFAFRLNDKNKIEFRNLFNQIGVNQATLREGINYNDEDFDERSYFMRYESRSIYTGQLQGTHTSANAKNIFTWTSGFNYLGRQEPDFRRVRTLRERGSEGPYRVVVPINAPSPNNAGRLYSDLTETAYIAGGQLEHIFGSPDSVNTGKNLRLKAGFYAERKDRSFASRYFGNVLPFLNENDPAVVANREKIVNLPLDQIFAPANFDARNGFILNEGTRISDRYNAANNLGAGYLALTKTLWDKITLYGGVRAEYNDRQVEAVDYSGRADVADPTFNLLPSLNVAYNFNMRSLVRFAYGMTVNRPEFREQARFSYFDFIENASTQGNNNLRAATIQNLDLRYEFYPTPSELLSIGAFYKNFSNAIETIIYPGTDKAPIYSYRNSESAYSLGIEAEARKSFRDVSASPFLQNLSLVLNASLIHSRVNLGADADKNQEQKRALQGQSPYIVNAGVYYQNDDNGWQTSLMYNVLGSRIYRVGSFNGNPTVYEMPRQVIDLSVTKNLKKGFQLKAGIQDLLNQPFRFVQDTDMNSKISAIVIRFKTIGGPAVSGVP